MPKLNKKRFLFITAFSLIVLAVCIYAVSIPTKTIKKAQENLTDAKDTDISLSPVEEKTLSLKESRTADIQGSLKNGTINVIFAKGSLDAGAAGSQSVKLTLLPQTPNRLVRFSLSLSGQPGGQDAGAPKDKLTDDKTGQEKPYAQVPFSGEAIASKTNYYTLEYDYADTEAIYAPSSLKFIWMNPETQSWDTLPTTLDEKTGKITTRLDHFSDFGVSGVKAQVFSPTLKNWETSLYTGAITYSLPIETVPGIGGLSPNLSISYNSNRANSLFDEQKGSLLGAGWDMTLPEIRFDLYATSNEFNINSSESDCQRVSGTRKEGPQYSLVLGGKEEPLAWIKDETDVQGKYGMFVTKSGGARVKGYYGTYLGNSTFNTAFGSSCRNKIITHWQVQDTGGSLYIFRASGLDHANRKIFDRFVPTRYMLVTTTNLQGNTVSFDYQLPPEEKVNDHLFTVYPKSISYNNNKAKVVFTLEPKENPTSVPKGDNPDEYNLEKSRLKEIIVYSDGADNTILRTYRFVYETAAYRNGKDKFDILKKVLTYVGPNQAPVDNTPTANMLVPSEFFYTELPTGLDSEYLTTNQTGLRCNDGTTINFTKPASLPDRPTTWNDIKTNQNSRLREAGFGNCSGGNISTLPAGNLCPISAEARFYTYSIDICKDNNGPDALQGTAVYWEKTHAPFLTQVNNNYGGQVKFDYKNIHDGKFGLNRDIVIRKTLHEERLASNGSPDVTLNYQYDPIIEDGSGRLLNKAGGFGRVSQTDANGISTTTFYYPLAPSQGDGNVNPETNPFYGLPLRTVVHKIDGNKDKIYSDQFTTYSFIPLYDPQSGFSDNDLLLPAGSTSWKSWTVSDNLLSSGFGKTVTAVSDSFSPKKVNFIEIVGDKNKPQYIPTDVRNSAMLHTQNKVTFDQYGLPVKTVSLGDVNDNANGFNVTGDQASLAVGRTADNDNLKSVSLWWLDAGKFTYGLPFNPVLFASPAGKPAENSNGTCIRNADYKQGPPYDCSNVIGINMCCASNPNTWPDGTTCFNPPHGNKACPVNDRLSICSPDSQIPQCLSYTVRNPTVTGDPISSGTEGNLKKYAYTDYLRSNDYLQNNIRSLVAQTFISNEANMTFDDTSNPKRWNWVINNYDEAGFAPGNGKFGYLTSSIKRNTVPADDPLVSSPNEIKTTTKYNGYGNPVEQTDARWNDGVDTGNGSMTQTIYNQDGSAYDNILPKEIKVIGKNGFLFSHASTAYNDLWLPLETRDLLNETSAKIAYDCLGRLKEVYKSNPDPNSPFRVSDKPAIIYQYFDYLGADTTGSNCVSGLLAPNGQPLPHLRTETRISTNDNGQENNDIYLTSDQISDGLGQARQAISYHTLVNGEYKNLVSETVYNEFGLKQSESTPIVMNFSDVPNVPQFISIPNESKNQRYTAYDYDELGRATQVTNPLGLKSRTEYAGLTTTSYDANNSGLNPADNPAFTKTETNGFGRTVYTIAGNITDSGSSNPVPAQNAGILSRMINSIFGLNTTTVSPVLYGLYSKPQYHPVLDTVIISSQYTCDNPKCEGGGKQKLSESSTNYDHLGRKWSATDPDLGTWKYLYDANGNIIKQIDAKNQIMTFQYDDINRLVKKEYPGNPRGTNFSARDFLRFVYDTDADDTGKTLAQGGTGDITDKKMYGKRIRLWDTTGNTYFEYDRRGRLTKDIRKINMNLFNGKDHEINTTTYDYFESDALKSTTLPNGEIVKQVYNETGQLKGVKTQIDQTIQDILLDQQYNRFGALTASKLNNTLESTKRYDELGRLTKICVAKMGTDLGLNCDNTQAPKLLEYLYAQRDNVGNITGLTMKTGQNSIDLRYNYDKLYQLTGVIGSDAKYNSQYSYDPEGNMLQKTEGENSVNMNYQYPDSTLPAPRHAPKIVNGATYHYDNNGNLSEDEARCYEWDFDNKPISIYMKKAAAGGCNDTNKGEMTEFAYDGNGNRVMKKVTGGIVAPTPSPNQPSVTPGLTNPISAITLEPPFVTPTPGHEG